MDKSTLIGRHILPYGRQKPTNLSPLQGSTRITTRELVLAHEYAQGILRILIQGQGAISISRRSRMKTKAPVTRKNLRIKISHRIAMELVTQRVEPLSKWDGTFVYRPYCYSRGLQEQERGPPKLLKRGWKAV